MTLRTKKPLLFAPLACALALTGCPGPEPEVPDDIFGEMGEVAPWATAEQRATFERGREVAQRRFSPEDGLGPHFNVSFCGGCHERPVLGGGGPRYRNFLLIQNELPDGTVQPVGVEGIQPQYLIESGRHETPEGADIVATRNAIPFFGAGLLAEIPAESIERHADPDDADGDGVSGRVNRVWDAARGEAVLGRFGWKANEPNLSQQNQGAFLGDIGVTSPLFPDPECADGQAACAAAPSGGEPELTPDIVAFVDFYVSTLAVPARRDVEDPSVLRGKALFLAAGCGGCHVPRLETGEHPIEALAHQTIRPFTDLLLHDMGEGLADGRPDFEASGTEWRTPPLWGIGLLPVVNGHTLLLHDGRARGFAEAVLWHGGEAEAARESFRAMSADERADLVRFLESL